LTDKVFNNFNLNASCLSDSYDWHLSCGPGCWTRRLSLLFRLSGFSFILSFDNSNCSLKIIRPHLCGHNEEATMNLSPRTVQIVLGRTLILVAGIGGPAFAPETDIRSDTLLRL